MPDGGPRTDAPQAPTAEERHSQEPTSPSDYTRDAVPDFALSGTPADEVNLDAVELVITPHGGGDGPQPLEVTVTYLLEEHTDRTDVVAAHALSAAAERHPEFELIIVYGYGIGAEPGGPKQVEAWYTPHNLENIDLDNMDDAGIFEHCMSCFVPGHIHR